MNHFSQLKEKFKNNKPWLVIGKGPSFERIDEFVLTNWNTIGLNHVSLLKKVDIAHLIDIEVFYDGFFQSDYILAPLHPHIKCKATEKVLGQFPFSKTWYWYSLSTYKKVQPKPLIYAKYFSVEAVFHILALWNIKKIFTLGVDGGKDYAQSFTNLGFKPLMNGQPTFNKQFSEIKKVCEISDIDWIKL